MHIYHLIAYIGGGTCLGLGALNLYWSFGSVDGAFNSNLQVMGFSAIDNIRMLPASDFSIALLAIGLAAIVAANMTAWKNTDGY